MKIAAFIPIRNQEVRIQPLISEIKKRFFDKIDFFIFINENSSDQSEHVLEQELNKLHRPYHYTKMHNANRKDSFIQAYYKAEENKVDYIISFHEGWEDNIEEIHQLLLTQTFTSSAVTSAIRTPQSENLGHLLNTITNSLVSNKLSMHIPDTKGDSITIYKMSTLSVEILNNVHEQLYHLAIICNARNNKHLIQFFSVDNGLNFSSYIKLNIKRFLYILWYLQRFQLRS